MTLNLLQSNQTYFDTGVDDWEFSNGVGSRDLHGAPISFFKSSFSTLDRDNYNAAKIVSDGLGVTTATSASFNVVPEDTYLASVLVQTELHNGIHTGYAELEIQWEDGLGASIASQTLSYNDITQSAQGSDDWHVLVSQAQAPLTAVSGKLVVSFSSTTYDSGTSDGDVWRFAEPKVISYSDIPRFANTAYSNVPEFMRLADEELYLYRILSFMASYIAKISQTAEDFRYDRATENDGVEYLPKLVDPLTADPEYLPWIAYILGARLVTPSGDPFSPWSVIEEVANWDDLETTYLNWSEIESSGTISIDPEALNRQLLSLGASGVNRGRTDSLEAFLPRLTTDGSAPVIKNHFRGSSFLTKISLHEDADPDPVYGSGSSIERFSKLVFR